MTLGFKQYHQGKPTHFPERIIDGLEMHGLIGFKQYAALHELYTRVSPETQRSTRDLLLDDDNNILKIHTIRDNRKGLWKPGRDIHFVVGNRTKHRYQFAPVLPLKSMQKIIMELVVDELFIWIDGVFLEKKQDVERLAHNDGFETTEAFMAWFVPYLKEAPGYRLELEILHWTDFRY